MIEWGNLAVHELAAPTKSALATGPFGSSVGMKEFRVSGVPLVRGSSLSSDVGQRLIEDDLVFVDDELAERFSRSIAARGDLIFTCWGTINQVGLVDSRSKYEKYLVSNKQMKLTPDTRIVLPLFLYYFFSSPAGQSQIAMNAHGSSVPGFNLSKLKGIRVPAPPLAEQEYIVEVLGSLDDKIELNRRMNETLEAMAQAIFRDWFVDFGPTRRKLEGATDPVIIMGGLVTDPTRAQELADLFSATLGDNGLPEGWREGNVANFIEFNPKEPLRKGAVAPYSDMSSLPTQGPLAEAPVPRAFGSGMRFRNGDALLARITPCLENGKAALVDFLPDNQPIGWGSTEFFVMRSRHGVPGPMSYLFARDEAFRATAIASMTGTSGRQRAQVDRLESFPIAVPPPAVLKNFGRLVEPMFEKISANGRENRTLAATRDLLLPKLMSGEIRLGEAQELVEAAQ